ncbi:MAG TPA: HpcH/HpaI aldolase/citrate lyase family protein [Candidatus Lachnoclostridium stercoravium]|uniref:HpcH/HpaI aldolase/citrate lyase family protein n=1 Tax=Candidatus Lachnoclostridium stercoravium TaxID=2838633 RepID=A0A9D2HHI9_9FIRM|nr:HpcH/HpaI aldolase/citrate lyase family protein [Candidatus Lachnoclostridium stercoravium]
MKYSVGALLYSPALNNKIGRTILGGTLGDKYSLALCLEDTIAPDMVETAEKQAGETLRQLFEARQERDVYLPKLFIRVREPEQMQRVWKRIRPYREIFTGFIFPKYTVSNAAAYNQEMIRINEMSDRKIYMMPILESRDIVDFRTRMGILGKIRDQVDAMEDLVLNVRVGGNDFSNEFAARRHYDETIYDILPIAQLLGDILTVFSRDYVVSGPVWEFFSSDNHEWKRGLMQELKLDRLNGFIGKTVIHPKQIPVVNEMLKVTSKDYEDAKAILNWDNSGIQVGKSFGGERMNEVRTNYNWAKKTMLLSELYGII